MADKAGKKDESKRDSRITIYGEWIPREPSNRTIDLKMVSIKAGKLKTQVFTTDGTQPKAKPEKSK